MHALPRVFAAHEADHLGEVGDPLERRVNMSPLALRQAGAAAIDGIDVEATRREFVAGLVKPLAVVLHAVYVHEHIARGRGKPLAVVQFQVFGIARGRIGILDDELMCPVTHVIKR